MERVSKHKMKEASNWTPYEMAKARTFRIIREASIKEIIRLMNDYDISMQDLKKNGCE